MSGPPPASHDPANNPAHPAWCNEHQCYTDVEHGAAVHVSDSIEWQASSGDDVQLGLSHYRLDSLDHSNVEGWLLTLHHHGVDERASAMLTDHDLDMVAVARMQLRTAIMPRPQMWGTDRGVQAVDPSE